MQAAVDVANIQSSKLAYAVNSLYSPVHLPTAHTAPNHLSLGTLELAQYAAQLKYVLRVIVRILWLTASQMKCVGAEDGQKPCQRCKRTNVEYVGNNVISLDGRYILLSRCVFEKHRRGRKPGSKYDEMISLRPGHF
jgi:hypothetical protein